MKKFKRHVCTLMVSMLIFSTAMTGCTKTSDTTVNSNNTAPSSDTNITKSTAEKKVIVVDGGGDQVNYNSTKSMEKTSANPYPYNELELLAKEWMIKHPDVEIKILPDSVSKQDDALIPLLKSTKAPDIIFQNPGVEKNNNLDKNWFVPLNSYLDKPNKYVDGNDKWINQFNPAWMSFLKSMDNNYYYIPIDSIPIGLIYNKELFKKAGIDKAPETYTEFMEAQKKLKAIGVIPYLPIDKWYDIFLQGSFMANKISQLDVLRKDGIIDTEEIARGFEKNLLSLNMPEFQDYLKVVKEKTMYYPKGWQTANAYDEFVQGKIGMIEAVGVHMRMIRDDSKRKFDVGTVGFPLVTTEQSKYVTSNVVRGNAGFSTCWQITNSAVKKDTVDLCVDFLQYLTTAENNSRLVNKLCATAPSVIGAEPDGLFKPMTTMSEEDMKKGYLDWHACSLFDSFDGQTYDAYKKNLYPSYILGKLSAEQLATQGDSVLKKAIESVKKTANWDTSKW